MRSRTRRSPSLSSEISAQQVGERGIEPGAPDGVRRRSRRRAAARCPPAAPRAAACSRSNMRWLCSRARCVLGHEPFAHEVETRRAQQVARRARVAWRAAGSSPLLPRRSRRPKSRVRPRRVTDAPRCAGRGVLEVMSLVDDHAPVRRQHRRVVPVVATRGARPRRPAAGGGSPPPRRPATRSRRAVEQEAVVVVRTLEPSAQVGLRRHLVPHVGARRRGQVGHGAVGGVLRPAHDHVELARAGLVEERGAAAAACSSRCRQT